MKKRKFSMMKINEVMPLIGTRTIHAWTLNAPPRPPSDVLMATLQRLRSFDTTRTEAAK